MPKSHACDTAKYHCCLKENWHPLRPDINNSRVTKKDDNHNTSSNSSLLRFSKVIQNSLGEEKSSRNESVILALGIQHYIKEVFDALDYSRSGYVHYEDLQLLFKILGKEYETITDDSSFLCSVDRSDGEKCTDDSCKTHLHLDRFAEIIFDKFSTFSDNNVMVKRKNTQLVNAVVSVSRRSESLSVISKQIEELEKDYLEYKSKYKYFTLPTVNDTTNNCISCTKHRLIEGKNFENNVVLENMKLQRVILLQKQELQCLREVIEDLRISLQCSDAENLSLRVKREKLLLQDDHTTKSLTNSSSDEDKSRFDRIIQGFPSSEELDLSSNESLLTIRSLRSLSPSGSAKSSQLKIEERSSLLTKKLFDKIGEDDADLNKEIQSVYQELAETKNELENTQKELENTVSEIQVKNDFVNKLIKNLNEMKLNFDKSTEENSNLKEKIVTLRQTEKERDLRMQTMEKELQEMKSELHTSIEGTKNLKNELEVIKKLRKTDIQQLQSARNLVAKSLLKMTPNPDQKSSLRMPDEILEQSSFLKKSEPNKKQNENKQIVGFNGVKTSNVDPKQGSNNGEDGDNANYESSAIKNDSFLSVKSGNQEHKISNNRIKFSPFKTGNKISEAKIESSNNGENQIKEEKPVLEVRPSLSRPINVTRPFSRSPEPTANKKEPNFRSKGAENFESTSTCDFVTSNINQKYLSSEDKANNRRRCEISNDNLFSPPNSKISEERISELPDDDSNQQTKTSTEILESLEAEVEYLLSIL